MDFTRLPRYPGDGVPPGGFREPTTAAAAKPLTYSLDALDCLFDRVWTPDQVLAVLAPARDALRGTAHFDPFDRAVSALTPVVESGAGADVRGDRALFVTDGLRHYLAGLPENQS
jgi:hypothetical protein